MQISTLNLTTDGRVSLTAYIQQPSPEMPNRAVRPAVIILPGGAALAGPTRIGGRAATRLISRPLTQ